MTVKIDRRMTSDKKEAIVKSVEYDLGAESGFHIKNLNEITYDSLLFSYLVTLSVMRIFLRVRILNC